MSGQRRRLSIAMTPSEVDEFLTAARTAHLATSDARGRPHVTPIWFVWYGEAIWIHSLVNSQRWSDIQAHPDVAFVADDGRAYNELRGVEITGTARSVGSVPRAPGPPAELEEVELLFARKNGGPNGPTGHHVWLRIEPRVMVSWDHRKIPPRG